MDRLAFLRNALYEVNIKMGLSQHWLIVSLASRAHIPLVVSGFGY